MRNDFYVYLHKRVKDDSTFYVGRGTGARITSNRSRTARWFEIVNEDKGYLVEKVKENLTEDESKTLEHKLIKEFGREITGTGSLVNVKVGEWNSKTYNDIEKKGIKYQGSAAAGKKANDELRAFAKMMMEKQAKDNNN